MPRRCGTRLAVACGLLRMSGMRGSKLGLIVLLTAAPATAQPYDDYGDADYAEVAPGAPVESVDVFYDQLSPYGYWVDDPVMGRVFIPDVASYVPYRVGHWQYTNLGFVWISNEPFAWATSHYGRWAFSNVFNRWVWLPDTAWGPAWVDWRVSGNDFGWAPLAPEVVLEAGYEPPIFGWNYVPATAIFSVNLTAFFVPRERVVIINRDARPIENFRTIDRTRVVVGPTATVLREHRVEAKPVQLDAKRVGRMTPVEAKAQAVRAEQRKTVVEEQNRKRIEANPTVREAQRKAETMPKPPARVEQKPGGPQQPPAKVAPKPGEPAQPPTKVAPKPGEPAQPPTKTEPRPGEKQPPKVAPKPGEPAQPPTKQPPAKVAPKPGEPTPPPTKTEPRPGERQP